MFDMLHNEVACAQHKHPFREDYHSMKQQQHIRAQIDWSDYSNLSDYKQTFCYLRV